MSRPAAIPDDGQLSLLQTRSGRKQAATGQEYERFPTELHPRAREEACLITEGPFRNGLNSLTSIHHFSRAQRWVLLTTQRNSVAFKIPDDCAGFRSIVMPDVPPSVRLSVTMSPRT